MILFINHFIVYSFEEGDSDFHLRFTGHLKLALHIILEKLHVVIMLLRG